MIIKNSGQIIKKAPKIIKNIKSKKELQIIEKMSNNHNTFKNSHHPLAEGIIKLDLFPPYPFYIFFNILAT